MSRGTLDTALSGLVSRTGLSPSLAGLSRTILLPFLNQLMRSEPRSARTPVWAPSGSLAATSEITVVFFSSGYLDVSVHRVPFHALWIHAWIHKVFLCGFPHSDICGSKDICSSPQLFAAYHVFLRLSVPRHPPCALSCLTCSHSSSVRNAGWSAVLEYFYSFQRLTFVRLLSLTFINTSILHFFKCSLLVGHPFGWTSDVFDT